MGTVETILATGLTGCAVAVVACAFSLYARLVRLEERMSHVQQSISDMRDMFNERIPKRPSNSRPRRPRQHEEGT